VGVSYITLINVYISIFNVNINLVGMVISSRDLLLKVDAFNVIYLIGRKDQNLMKVDNLVIVKEDDYNITNTIILNYHSNSSISYFYHCSLMHPFIGGNFIALYIYIYIFNNNYINYIIIYIFNKLY